jgi:hypothetical protein
VSVSQDYTADLINNGIFDNGHFTFNASGWVLGSAWIHQDSALYADGSGAADASYNIDVINADDYLVEFEITAYTSGNLTPGIGGVSNGSFNTTGVHQTTITASGSGIQQLQFSADATFEGSVDNVRVLAISAANDPYNFTSADTGNFLAAGMNAVDANQDGILDGPNVPGEREYWKIVTQTTGTLSANTTVTSGQASTDTVGTLYESDGSTIVVMDDDSGDGRNFSFSASSLPASTYYLEVRGYSVPTSGYYDLETRFREDIVIPDQGENDASAETVVLAADQSTTIMAELDSDTDRDWFTITAPADGVITIYTTGPGGTGIFDTVGELFTTGDVAMGVLDDDGRAQLHFQIMRSMALGESINVQVSGYIAPAASTSTQLGRYEIHVQHKSGVGFDDPGIRDARLVYNSSTQQWESTGTQEVTGGLSVNAYLAQQIVDNSKVRGYDLTDSLGPDTSISGFLDQADSDLFFLDMSQGGALGGDLTITSTGETDTYAVLYSWDGLDVTIITQDDDSASPASNRNFNIDVTDLLPGQYFLEVVGFSAKTSGNYGLTLDYTEDSGVTPPLPLFDAYEDGAAANNDALGSATNLGLLGASPIYAPAAIQVSADQDWYKLDLLAGMSGRLWVYSEDRDTYNAATHIGTKAQLAKDDGVLTTLITEGQATDGNDAGIADERQNHFMMVYDFATVAVDTILYIRVREDAHALTGNYLMTVEWEGDRNTPPASDAIVTVPANTRKPQPPSELSSMDVANSSSLIFNVDALQPGSTQNAYRLTIPAGESGRLSAYSENNDVYTAGTHFGTDGELMGSTGTSLCTDSNSNTSGSSNVRENHFKMVYDIASAVADQEYYIYVDLDATGADNGTYKLRYDWDTSFNPGANNPITCI